MASCKIGFLICGWTLAFERSLCMKTFDEFEIIFEKNARLGASVDSIASIKGAMILKVVYTASSSSSISFHEYVSTKQLGFNGRWSWCFNCYSQCSSLAYLRPNLGLLYFLCVREVKLYWWCLSKERRLMLARIWVGGMVLFLVNLGQSWSISVNLAISWSW